jgi:hypothetical protein
MQSLFLTKIPLVAGSAYSYIDMQATKTVPSAKVGLELTPIIKLLVMLMVLTTRAYIPEIHAL